jgi:hypothetical protein
MVFQVIFFCSFDMIMLKIEKKIKKIFFIYFFIKSIFIKASYTILPNTHIKLNEILS